MLLSKLEGASSHPRFHVLVLPTIRQFRVGPYCGLCEFPSWVLKAMLVEQPKLLVIGQSYESPASVAVESANGGKPASKLREGMATGWTMIGEGETEERGMGL